MPRVEHVDPHRTHRDLAAVQHVERAGVARRHHDVLVEILQARQRFVDHRLVARRVGALLELVAEPLFAETQPITKPTPDMPPLTPL